MTITVEDVPESPKVVASTRTLWGVEDEGVAVLGVSFSDPDDLTQLSYVRLTTLTQGGSVHIQKPNDFTLRVQEPTNQEPFTIVGQVLELNRLFNGSIHFIPEKNMNVLYNQYGQITIYLEKYDPVLNIAISDSASLTLRVLFDPHNDPAILSVPGTFLEGQEDSPLSFSAGGISLTDSDPSATG